MDRRRQRKAFTIVEMVIVIAVIAILAAVLIPTISGVINMANKSADQQFAASLNVQLAMYSVDKPIESEADLRDAINYFYGKWEDEEKTILAADGDFYASLTPKSGNQGYHYWYNATDKQVVLAKYEDLLPDDGVAPTEIGVLSFSPASLRSLLIPTEEGEKNFFLMDQAGSEVVDLVVAFENLGDDGMVGSGSNVPQQRYEDAVNTLKDSAVAGSLEAALLAKVQVTTIVTGEGAYRFNDVSAIEHVYVPLSATIINVQKIYEYVPGADDAEGMVGPGRIPSATVQLATHAKVPVVQIPVGVKIASNGFPAIVECTDPSTAGDYQNATVLEIMTNDIADLTDAEGNFMFDLQTSNPVFKLLGSGLYVMIEDEVFSLPYNVGDDAVEIGGNVGTGTSQNLNVEVSFPNASANPGEGTHYFDGSTLYVQYDLTELPMTVTNGKHVIWEYTEVKAEGEEPDSDRIFVDKVYNKLMINSKIGLNDNNQIRVTGKINGVEKVSFIVCLIMPREVQVGGYNSTYDAIGVTGARPISLSFDGQTSFTMSFAAGYGINNKVAPWDITVASQNGKFTAALNDAKDKITITLGAEHDFDDVLIVTIGERTFNFAVDVVDNSGAAFENKLFYDADKDGIYDDGVDVKVGEKYLFRVGNKNSITLDKLFSTTQAYSEVALKLYDYSYTGQPVIGNGSAQTVTVGGATKADGTDYYTTIRDNWKNVSLLFGKTGVVKIEIGSAKNGVFTSDTFVLLEVVDGTNISTDDYNQMKSATNPVLWHDVTMPTGDYQYTLNSATLYGNGYKFDVSGGRTKGTYVNENYLVGLNSGTLDNVELIGAVYDEFGGTASKPNNNALVHVAGDSYIYNSYLANCMSPVRVRGNVTIVDTTIQGGSFANMEVREGTVTFEGNVVTINQTDLNAANGINKVGLGIVVYYEGVPETTTIIVKGTLTQYNFLSENDKSKLGSPSGSVLEGNIDYTGELLKEMLKQTDYVFKIGDVKWVHTGIISMMSTFDGDNLEGSISGYKGPTPVSSHNQTGTAWAIPSQNGASAMSQMLENYSVWQPSGQGVARPKVTQDTTSWVSPNNGNDWKKWQNGQVDISMDQGDSTTWNPNILTIKKGDKTLVVDSIKVKGYDTNYKGQSITFGNGGLGAGEYVVVYTYTDTHNYNTDGTAKSITYEYTVKIKVSEVAATAKNAVFELAPGKGYSTKTVTSGGKTYLVLDIPASEVGSAVSGFSQVFTTTKGVNVAKQTIGGTTYYIPARAIDMSDGKTTHSSGWYAYFSIFDGVIQITDYADQGTGAEIIYNDASSSVPSGLSVNGDPTQLFIYSSASSAGASPVEKNDKWVYSSAKIEANRSVTETSITYIYTDNKGATFNYQVMYYAPAQTYDPGCVTPDTLVTLADGTQKEIQYVTSNDQLLVWDSFNGKYTVVPAAIIVNHGFDTWTVIELNFDDGTTVKAITAHAFLDTDTNAWELINATNVQNYVGHSFVRADGDGYTTVKLESYKVYQEYTESYTLVSAGHYNFITENMFSVTNSIHPFAAGLEIGEGMKYDAETLREDIEKYGLYTYANFSDYITEDVYNAFNGAFLKISVEKGYLTFEGILQLIEEYL